MSAMRTEARVGDPVVIDGTKFRIASILGNTAECRDRFTKASQGVALTALRWDAPVGVWRVAK